MGVRSIQLVDASRGLHALEIELWYPAHARYQGLDLAAETQDLYSVFGVHQVRQEAARDAAPEPGSFPLVLFSHGMAGHRRQSTFFCTHLASHGYVVLSPDHGGSTLADLFNLAMQVGPANLHRALEPLLARYVADRPLDLRFLVDAVAAGTISLALNERSGSARIDLSRVGASGHSFGGFTALAAAARDPRLRAVVALAPAGGEGPLSSPALSRELSLDFGGRVTTLYLALERDSLLPLAGIEQLYRRTSGPKRLFVLPNADHMHFCDRAESSHEFFRNIVGKGVSPDWMGSLPPFSELAPSSHGYAFANALGLAHFDAALKADRGAAQFLAEGAVEAFAGRGMSVRAA